MLAMAHLKKKTTQGGYGGRVLVGAEKGENEMDERDKGVVGGI